jgi:hypothetical protein
MEAMGIRGKSIGWFRSYLTGARQRVVWDGQVSDVVDVEYCVRQGSLLGLVLYLLHVSDLPLALEIRDSDGDSGYADDMAVWVVAEDHKEAYRKPYLHSLAREARFSASRVARMAQHLPRGQLLQQLGSGLLMGKVAHCLPVVAMPRLTGSTAEILDTLAQVQVAVNDMARSVVGYRREDHITIVEAAKFLLLNYQAVKATTMSAWTAFHSCNGSNKARNPVGEAMFSNAELPTARASRSTMAGEVWVRTRGMDTHVTHGHMICSGIPPVRRS